MVIYLSELERLNAACCDGPGSGRSVQITCPDPSPVPSPKPVLCLTAFQQSHESPT